MFIFIRTIIVIHMLFKVIKVVIVIIIGSCYMKRHEADIQKFCLQQDKRFFCSFLSFYLKSQIIHFLIKYGKYYSENRFFVQ
jgi:hypothetical protein